MQTKTNLLCRHASPHLILHSAIKNTLPFCTEILPTLTGMKGRLGGGGCAGSTLVWGDFRLKFYVLF